MYKKFLMLLCMSGVILHGMEKNTKEVKENLILQFTPSENYLLSAYALMIDTVVNEVKVSYSVDQAKAFWKNNVPLTQKEANLKYWFVLHRYLLEKLEKLNGDKHKKKALLHLFVTSYNAEISRSFLNYIVEEVKKEISLVNQQYTQEMAQKYWDKDFSFLYTDYCELSGRVAIALMEHSEKAGNSQKGQAAYRLAKVLCLINHQRKCKKCTDPQVLKQIEKEVMHHFLNANNK